MSKGVRRAYRQREPKYYLIVLIVVLLTFGIVIYLLQPDLKKVEAACDPRNANPSLYDIQLTKNSKQKFDLELARTTAQQDMGLSARPCLPDNTAMLFLFPQDDRFGIWMKDMRFSIDVVWLNKDKEIVHIEKSMDPHSYPKVYYPSDDARYVIEFNKGTVDQLQAHVGTQLNW